jgi:hypothetical protein
MTKPKNTEPRGTNSSPEAIGAISYSELPPPSEGYLRDAFDRMMPIVTDVNAFNGHLKKVVDLPPQRIEALVMRTRAGVPFLESPADILDDETTNNFPVRWALANGTEPVTVRVESDEDITVKVPVRLSHDDVIGIRNGTFSPKKIRFGMDITEMEAYQRAIAAFPDYFVPLTESMSRFASEAAYNQQASFKTALRQEYEEPLYVAWQAIAPLVDVNDQSFTNFTKAGGLIDWYMKS